MARRGADEYAVPRQRVQGPDDHAVAGFRQHRKEERRPDIFTAMAERGVAVLEPRPLAPPPKREPGDLLKLGER